jgi:predicted nuclease with TOPRIM domain
MEEIHNHTTAERDHLFKISHEYKEEVDRLKEMLIKLEREQSTFNEIQVKYNEVSVLSQRLQEQNRIYEGKLREILSENERLVSILREREASAGVVADLRQRINSLSTELANRADEAR